MGLYTGRAGVRETHSNSHTHSLSQNLISSNQFMSSQSEGNLSVVGSSRSRKQVLRAAVVAMNASHTISHQISLRFHRRGIPPDMFCEEFQGRTNSCDLSKSCFPKKLDSLLKPPCRHLQSHWFENTLQWLTQRLFPFPLLLRSRAKGEIEPENSRNEVSDR